jgi:cyclic beta-1,2-glucan synthetase
MSAGLGMAAKAGRGGSAPRLAATSHAAARVKAAVEAHAWDGRWYRRAYFDDGRPLGSAESPECQIDSLPQSWAVLSGAAGPERAQLAMQSALAGSLR